MGEIPQKRITAMSNVLRTTPDDDELGLLFAISEGFDEIKRVKEEWRVEDLEREAEKREAVELEKIKSLEKLRSEVIEEQQDDFFNEGEDLPGAFGESQGTRWSLLLYFKSLGSTKEKRLVAIIAYGACIIALCAGLTLIALQYAEARASKSRAIQFVDKSSLVLPDIHVCNTASSFPPFLHLPTEKHVGSPTTWIDTVLLPGKKGTVIHYPETHNRGIFKQMKMIGLNRFGKECVPTSKADPVIFMDELKNPPSCFYCWYIARTPPLVINKKFGTINERTQYANAFTMRVSRMRLVEKCRIVFATPSANELYAFRSMIIKHADKLESKGIMDFNGINATDPKNWDLLFPRFRRSILDFAVRDVFDMYCNVYLFSDFFFPASDTNIRYQFVPSTHHGNVGLWVRVGRGPYFPPDYDEWVQVVNRRMSKGGGGVVAENELKRWYLSRGDMLTTYSNTTLNTQLVQYSSQSPGSIMEINLEKALVQSIEVYSARVHNTDLKRVDTRGVDYIYILRIGFAKFVTRYETDMFVSPILMRFKRRSVERNLLQNDS